MFRSLAIVGLIVAAMFNPVRVIAQNPLPVRLQLQRLSDDGGREFELEYRDESWDPGKTALIVCDAWDFHHCLNAVRRLEEFAPRLNQVVSEARRRGVTIIHAPSDCMEAYQNHPARQRAIETQLAEYVPADIQSWCSVIPAEARAAYPIDQSDGGEDDDPQEHAQWAEKLQAMGRNPSAPWNQQTELISIDAQHDYISDSGQEIWSILEQHGIRNVILTGVHTNMCVLGRPFGLRQLARNGKNVVLMRDMTDTMYNPQSWPYVSHFEGTRRVIAYIEQYVCPTITSDQIIGGTPFHFARDEGAESATANRPANSPGNWQTVPVPHLTREAIRRGDDDDFWYRCVVYIPAAWIEQGITLLLGDQPTVEIWCNGQALRASQGSDGISYDLDRRTLDADDANLIVIRIGQGSKETRLTTAPELVAGEHSLSLAGRWQFRVGTDSEFSTMPLPAKFGGSADVVFQPEEPLWTPRVVTRRGEFTAGIEGPACDAQGNVYAVNYAAQGTIGRVKPNGQGEVFVTLPGESVGNGIRFGSDGSFFVADYVGHNILRVEANSRKITVHAHQPEMNQPNDLAITPDGKTLFASDPNWSAGTGQVWRIDEDGRVTKVADKLGTSNGIEVSPDGKTLYVNESKQRNVWAFTITQSGDLAEKRLVREFPDYGFDGMRCDVDGNLYITRYGKGTVVKMTPTGEILREIPVLGPRPSNLCFGGPDGRTVYVTEVESQRLVSFRADRPGR